jgi:hypothetical protein
MSASKYNQAHVDALIGVVGILAKSVLQDFRAAPAEKEDSVDPPQDPDEELYKLAKALHRAFVQETHPPNAPLSRFSGMSLQMKQAWFAVARAAQEILG